MTVSFFLVSQLLVLTHKRTVLPSSAVCAIFHLSWFCYLFLWINFWLVHWLFLIMSVSNISLIRSVKQTTVSQDQTASWEKWPNVCSDTSLWKMMHLKRTKLVRIQFASMLSLSIEVTQLVMYMLTTVLLCTTVSDLLPEIVKITMT
jgi:hypothetical protein